MMAEVSDFINTYQIKIQVHMKTKPYKHKLNT